MEILLKIGDWKYAQSIEAWISIITTNAKIWKICKPTECLIGGNHVTVTDAATGILVKVLDLALQIPRGSRS